jgi:hypothetical protein
MTLTILCFLLLTIAYLAREPKPGIARKRKVWMRERYDLNPALRRR